MIESNQTEEIQDSSPQLMFGQRNRDLGMLLVYLHQPVYPLLSQINIKNGVFH